ncbi:MAG: right-handed parallel beta-helix repeat-containing protein, partial [Verrucomicrobiaceae bacterium]
MRMSPTSPAAAFAAVLVLTISARAATFTVTSAADSGPGSLRQMLAEAALAPGADTVIMAPALSGSKITLLSPIIFDGAGGDTLDATALPARISFDTGGPHRCFSVCGGANLTLAGISIFGKNAPGSGGRIANQGTLALTNCSISGSSAVEGGAVSNQGTLTLTNCEFSGNSAARGGAVYNGGNLTALDCLFSRNAAEAGGGAIHNGEGSRLMLSRCTLSENTAGSGGAVSLDETGAIIESCSFTGNSAPSGGAIHESDSSLVMRNCTLAGNAADSGGAIGTNNEGVLELTHCTLSENSAALKGGAVSLDEGELKLTNSIVGAN